MATIKIKDAKEDAKHAKAEEPAVPETDAGGEARAAEGPAAAAPPPEREQALTEEEKTYKEQLLRMAADFDNFRKRTNREKGESFDRGVAALAEGLLPVLDNLVLALDHARKTEKGAALCKGLEMVQRMFLEVLEQNGIRPVDLAGGKFDPRLHEAVVVEPSREVPPDTILGEVQRGYLHKDRLLRPAKVRIAVAPPQAEDPAVN